MTCIIAVERAGGVAMMGDRRVSWGSSYESSDVPKIAEVGPVLIGGSGPVRMTNLAHAISPPTQALTWDVDRWVTLHLIPALRQQMVDHQFEKSSEGRATTEGTLLVAVSGRVYEIATDWSWTRNAGGLYAIGSGREYALGALIALLRRRHASHAISDALMPIMHEAMGIAAECDSGVAPPFDVFVQSRGGES